MREPVDPDDLAGVAELASALNVSRQTICNWSAGRVYAGFPPPLTRLKATPIWSAAAVTAWHATTKGP